MAALEFSGRRPRPRRTARICASLALGCASGLVATSTHAQSAIYYDQSASAGVRERLRPDYDPLGINVGAFQILPRLTISPQYDDNIFASQADRQSDFITAFAPAVSVRSDWSRNAVFANASAVSTVYAKHGEENTTDVDLQGGGRYDLFHGAFVTATAEYGHQTEPRTAEDTVQSSRDPIEYDFGRLSFGATQPLNRLSFNESVDYYKYSYQDTVTFSGAPLPQGYRDDQQITASGRAAYNYDADISVFFQASYNDRSYDEKPPEVLFDRSSHGYELTVGSNFQLSRLLQGELSVGFLNQEYSSSAFHHVDGPTVHGRIEYFVTPLTTLTFTAQRNVIDTGDPRSVSALQTYGRIEIDHELRRNIILSARAGYEDDDYTGIDRDDRRPNVSVSASYLLNRGISLAASYSYLDQESSGADRFPSYSVDVVSLSLVLQR